MGRIRVCVLASAVAVASFAGCTADTSGPSATTFPTASTPPTTPAKIVLPDDGFGAVPLLHRGDLAKGQFHVKLVNRSGEQHEITALQLVWDGFTSPLTERRIVIVGNQRLDVPVPFPGARCAGDGTEPATPDVGSATVRLVLADGTERSIPVYDVDGVARSLYLKDCERQMIERTVDIQWADLREVDLDGRPVTEGRLLLSRREGSAEVAVLTVSHTVVFTVEPLDVSGDGILVVLASDDRQASARVRFVESRCDPHAIAEASQPFNFVVQLQIDGEPHPYLALPPAEDQPAMRQRLDAGCQALGEVEPVR